MYFLQYCLNGHKPFESWLEDPGTELPAVVDLLPGLWVAFLLITCRVLFNAAFRPTALSWATGAGEDRRHRAHKLLEEVWVTAGGLVLVVWAWHATRFGGPECSLFSMEGCIRGWPFHVRNPPQAKHYYWVEVGWYIHLTMKHFLGYGLRDGSDMQLHHGATLALIVLSYLLNGAHVGAFVMALFNISNPLLHASKLANEQGWRRARVCTFALFAAVFFGTRIVLYPLSVLRLSLVQSVHEFSAFWRDVAVLYVVFNVLLLLLYLLQLQWMAGIIRILQRALSKDGFEAAGRFSALVDPTVWRKREHNKTRRKQQSPAHPGRNDQLASVHRAD